MSRKVFTAQGSVAVGPYSHAVEAGEFVYLSGQTPAIPGTSRLVEGGIEAQTAQCFENLKNVLASAGLSLDDVVKVNVFLTDMRNFKAMNDVYAAQFHAPYPARSTVGVRELPLGAMVEIEMIARKG